MPGMLLSNNKRPVVIGKSPETRKFKQSQPQSFLSIEEVNLRAKWFQGLKIYLATFPQSKLVLGTIAKVFTTEL
jgi:hypothetical protein